MFPLRNNSLELVIVEDEFRLRLAELPRPPKPWMGRIKMSREVGPGISPLANCTDDLSALDGALQVRLLRLCIILLLLR